MSSAVAPITATARSQRTGDTGLPQTHSGRCPSSHGRGQDRQPSSDMYPRGSATAKVSHTLLWSAKAKCVDIRSEDKLTTAGTALGVSIQAAAPNITSQLFG